MSVMKTGTGRPDRDPQGRCNLGQLEAVEVAQHEEGPLLDRETAEAALELIPVDDLTELVACARDLDRKDPEVEDAIALTFGIRKAGAHDQAMEPGIEPVRVAKAGKVTPGGHERVLERVLRPIDVAEDSLCEREQAVAPNPDQVGVGLTVSVSRRLDEIAVHRVRP
jgi:hypothetical protein